MKSGTDYTNVSDTRPWKKAVAGDIIDLFRYKMKKNAISTGLKYESRPVMRNYQGGKYDASDLQRMPRSIESGFRKEDDRDQNDIISFVSNNKYSILKYIFYAAIIPPSARSLENFMLSLDLYSDTRLIFAMSIVITIAADWLAMDLFSKSSLKFSGIRNFLFALIIIALNMGMFMKYIEIDSNKNNDMSTYLDKFVGENEVERKKTEIEGLEEEVKVLRNDFATKESAYLVKKWPHASDRKGCEDHTIKKGCGLEYSSVTNSKGVTAEYEKAKSLYEDATNKLNEAKESLRVKEARKALMNISESKSEMKLFVYLTVWILILMTIICTPRTRPI